jgi:O-antigen/teichoic acid export membrane protein
MMAFPLGFALSLQGMVTMIGLLLGPVAVVTFATLRTLSRFVFQLGGVISNATWPEASFAFSSRDLPLARALHRRGFQAVGWLTVSLAVATIAVAPFLLKAWTRGVVSFDALMLGTLLVVAVIDATWTASSVVVMAAGKYRAISVRYALCTAVSLVAAGMTLRAFGVEAAPFALLAGSLVMLPYALRSALHLTEDHPVRFSDLYRDRRRPELCSDHE